MIVNQNDYRDAGFIVFGLHGFKDGQCLCENPKCAAPGKHPLISRWSLCPQWSGEQWEAMHEAGQFNYGYGVLCKGYIIIDVDSRNGGVKSYKKLCEDIKIDLDKASGFIVETGSGGGSKHVYFKGNEGASYIQKLQRYEGLDIKTSGYIVGSGSKHVSGSFYETLKGHPSDIDDAPQALLDLLVRPQHHRADYNGVPLDLSEKELIDLLNHVDPDVDYETWIRCGMAIHHTTQGSGFNIWNDWSASGDKYPDIEDLQKHWHSFGRSANPVTIGTLIHYAQANGYIPPVTFAPEPEAPKDGLPVDISNIDVLRPPGLVGQLTAWINSQCRYPREHLAVIGALISVSNIAGLRYTDDKDGINLNMLSLCVAGSATGKEAILQSVTNIHSAVNFQRAVVGSIKSEQEIIRNLVRNQAAYYLIDEVGYLLQKIQSGKSSYLDGVIACIMAAYSKADGTFLLTGDMKETVAIELGKELSQCQSKIENNEDPSGYYQRRADNIQDIALPQIELGLERPYLSMMGMTTPVSFDSIVTAEQATNGFVGRCLLVREPETNPRRKRGFKQPSRKLPDNLMMALSQLSGFTGEDMTRVEHYGDKITIETTGDAFEMLEDIADWLEDFAETHKARTGLEAIIRRSYELVAKISAILAVSEGVRTVEHVRFAFAVVCKDIETKIRLAEANMNEGTSQALKNRIINEAGEGESEKTICTRIARTAKYKKEDVIKMINLMVESGELITFEKVHPVNKKKTLHYLPKPL